VGTPELVAQKVPRKGPFLTGQSLHWFDGPTGVTKPHWPCARRRTSMDLGRRTGRRRKQAINTELYYSRVEVRPDDAVGRAS
jgi:hypothetical protein